MSFIHISDLAHIQTHSRFFLNLRSKEGVYRPLILFRLTDPEEGNNHNDEDGTQQDGLSSGAHRKERQRRRQIYVMEANCPHLGADMSHAEIEDLETSVVAVCPWHRYDFDLETGESETGLRACTFAVEVRRDEDSDVDVVWMAAPEGGSEWRVIELRPVSEEFAVSRVDQSQSDKKDNIPISTNNPISGTTAAEDVVPSKDAPTTLMEWAVLILNTPNPRLKVERTRHAVNLYRTGQLKSIGNRAKDCPTPPDMPSREDVYTQNMMDPAKVKNRRNRGVMLHALANIEQWAIDLAWDIIARFGPKHAHLPPAFFSDFAKMALDESKHFSLLVSRLEEVSPATPYGSLPVHAALWESATETRDSLLARLAIVHLVHEARGLDVNPGTIARFKRAGDEETVKVMEVIHADEVTHVTTGHRWFTYMCARQGLDPVQAFRAEVRKGWKGEVKGPFNIEDREKAGLSRDFYEDLRGDGPLKDVGEIRGMTTMIAVQTSASAVRKQTHNAVQDKVQNPDKVMMEGGDINNRKGGRLAVDGLTSGLAALSVQIG